MYNHNLTTVNPKPYLVQRMQLRKGLETNAKEHRLSFRFEHDYMGSTEFERGTEAKTIRRIADEPKEVVNVQIGSAFVRAIFPTSRYTKDGVVEILTKLYSGDYRLKERSEFDESAYNKRREKIRMGYTHISDTWMDIETGLFWTWTNIAIKDVESNFTESVKFIDMAREEKEAKYEEDHKRKKQLLEEERTEQAAADMAVGGSLREMLIASGRLKPRQ